MPKVKFVESGAAGGDPRDPIEIDVAAGTSILEASERAGSHVGSACGGNLACSTCHVWVIEGLDSLGEISEAEDDIMDKAFDVREESRLGCQACVSDEDVVVEITPESLQAWLDEHPAERAKAG